MKKGCLMAHTRTKFEDPAKLLENSVNACFQIKYSFLID
jgi:hypothetical protein